MNRKKLNSRQFAHGNKICEICGICGLVYSGAPLCRGHDHWLPVIRYPASWAVNAAPRCFFSGETPDPQGIFGYTGEPPIKSGVCAARCSLRSGCCIFFVPAGRQCPQASSGKCFEFAHGAPPNHCGAWASCLPIGKIRYSARSPPSRPAVGGLPATPENL